MSEVKIKKYIEKWGHRSHTANSNHRNKLFKDRLVSDAKRLEKKYVSGKDKK